MRPITVLDAPCNLGLRPPAPGVVPGCYKLAGAVRDQRFLSRIGGVDAGCVVPPRYDISGWPADAIFHGAAMAEYTRRLADRVGGHVARGEFLVLLGGDCSILLGSTLALCRLGRYGLAYFDGSADFLRVAQPGWRGAAAAQTLALVTGRGQPDLVDIDGLGPYVRDSDIVVLGNRDDDEDVPNLARAGIACWTAPAIQKSGPGVVAARTLETFAGLDGFWVHVDADVLDIEVMPAVDAPDPGGLEFAELIDLLRPLLADSRCVGMQLTIFDPDLDPAGTLAAELTDAIVAALGR